MRCRAASLLALIISIAGCAGIPAYRLKITAPNKDVLQLVVYLEERADAQVYRRIALRELERIRAGNPPRGVPLYEVSVEFEAPGPERRRLARVIARFPSGELDVPAEFARASAERIETTVY